MHSAVQILSKCPTPNKSLPEIWTDREDVPKTPMDSSAEDPRPVLDDHSPAPAGGSSAPYYQGCTMRIQNGFEGFTLMQGTPQKAKTQGLLDWNISKLWDAEVHAQVQPSLQPGTPLAELTCLTQWLGSVYMWCF